MVKNKLQKFSELSTLDNVLEPPFEKIYQNDHSLKGNWRGEVFKNNHPIGLELGCGKGEYTLALADQFKTKNFIGVDIKGARIWSGANKATANGLDNVFFLRTRIEFIEAFFAPNEIDEIWITFPDPQDRQNRYKNRLTAPMFLDRYKKVLKPGGVMHLKTDHFGLYQWTLDLLTKNPDKYTVWYASDDVYAQNNSPQQENHYACLVQTYYERKYLTMGKKICYLKFGFNGE